jgi:hypothetical protein
MAKDDIKGALADLMGSAPSKKPEAVQRKTEKDRLENLPKGRSEIISFRVPKGEKARLADLFKELEGLSLADGVKRAVYDFLKRRKA